MKTRIFSFAGIWALAAALFFAVPAVAGETDAGQFIKVSAKKTFAELGVNMSDEEREKRFRRLLLETFDLPAIARFTLGRYWRRATPEQRDEFVKLFEDFVVLAYSNRFRDLSGKKFEIKNVSKTGDHETLVASLIYLPGQAPVRVGWRVRNSGETFKIIDVTVEGISMSVTQRDEFATVIRQSGGQVAGLLRALRKKTGKG